MSLTKGNGPFAPEPGGVFNFTRQGPDRVLYLAPSPKRIRVEFNGVTVADSRAAHTLHETGLLPVYYLPHGDVRADVLDATDHRTHCPIKGDASYWSVRVGDRVADNAAWTYPAPLDSAPWLAGLVAFDFRAMDRWLEEDEAIDIHPRDPFTRIDVRVSTRRVRVVCAGEVVAESLRPRMLFETGLAPRFYLPAEDVRTDRLVASDTVTRCPYKGTASYWSLAAGPTDVAWSYPEPFPEAARVAGHFCFDGGPADVEVDAP
jgi:uncharacterized protein (DUF427 family)